jgi:hypothetical protein
MIYCKYMHYLHILSKHRNHKSVWNHHIKISIRYYVNQHTIQLSLQRLFLNHKGIANKTITTSINNLLLSLTPLFYIML